MEQINSFVKTLVCVITISFFARGMLPENSMDKYVNYVIGLVIAVTLAGAFLNLTGIKGDEFAFADAGEVITGEEADKIYKERISSAYERELKFYVESFVKDKCGLESRCDIMLEKDLEQNVVSVEGIYVKIYGEYDYVYLENELAKTLGIDKSAVYIGGT